MGLKLFGREIIFEEFQPMWSWYLNVTDGQTTCNLISALCVASRGNNTFELNNSINHRKITVLCWPRLLYYEHCTPVKWPLSSVQEMSTITTFVDQLFVCHCVQRSTHSTLIGVAPWSSPALDHARLTFIAAAVSPPVCLQRIIVYEQFCWNTWSSGFLAITASLEHTQQSCSMCSSADTVSASRTPLLHVLCSLVLYRQAFYQQQYVRHIFARATIASDSFSTLALY